MIDTVKIAEDVASVLSYSQGFDVNRDAVDEIIGKWHKNKSHFIDMFGGKLIYEYPEPVKFSLTEEGKARRLSQFMERIECGETFIGKAAFLDFLYQNQNSFYDNIVSVQCEGIDEKMVPVGTKLIKAFKYFIKENDRLRRLQDEASMLIQEDCLSGIFCISVHPLDFLSSSENMHNWRSCHSLDGDYRAGNLSYMMDNSTVICYLKSASDDCQITHFPPSIPWNSKKWRRLFFFSKDMNLIMAGREYPFQTSEGSLDLFADIIEPMLCQRNGEGLTEWNKVLSDKIKPRGKEYYGFIDVGTSISSIIVHDAIVSIGCIIEEPYATCNFNDLLYSSNYVPYYLMKYRSDGLIFPSLISLATKRSKLLIGSAVPCLKCGENTVLNGEGCMLCEDCLQEDN